MRLFKATSRLAVIDGNLFHFSSRCSHTPLRVFYVLLACTCLCLPGQALANTIQLGSNTDTATAGFFQLEWQAPVTPGEVRLEESRNGDFSDATLVYRGADRATVISGKSDGRYYYRISSSDAAMHSNTLVITVRHHPLALAFSFFTVGGIVFIAILIVIVTGNRKTRLQS